MAADAWVAEGAWVAAAVARAAVVARAAAVAQAALATRGGSCRRGGALARSRARAEHTRIPHDCAAHPDPLEAFVIPDEHGCALGAPDDREVLMPAEAPHLEFSAIEVELVADGFEASKSDALRVRVDHTIRHAVDCAVGHAIRAAIRVHCHDQAVQVRRRRRPEPRLVDGQREGGLQRRGARQRPSRLFRQRPCRLDGRLDRRRLLLHTHIARRVDERHPHPACACAEREARTHVEERTICAGPIRTFESRHKLQSIHAIMRAQAELY